MVTVIKYHEQFFLTVWTITASGSKLTFCPQKRFMGSSHKVAPTFLTGSPSTRSTTVRTENHSYQWPLVQRTKRPKRSTVTLTTITRSPISSTRKSRQGSLGMEMFDLVSVVIIKNNCVKNQYYKELLVAFEFFFLHVLWTILNLG